MSFSTFYESPKFSERMTYKYKQYKQISQYNKLNAIYDKYINSFKNNDDIH